jgi:hypothetical protein
VGQPVLHVQKPSCSASPRGCSRWSVLGSIARPEALIVGRYDARGRLRVAGRTTALPRPARAELG